MKPLKKNRRTRRHPTWAPLAPEVREAIQAWTRLVTRTQIAGWANVPDHQLRVALFGASISRAWAGRLEDLLRKAGRHPEQRREARQAGGRPGKRG